MKNSGAPSMALGFKMLAIFGFVAFGVFLGLFYCKTDLIEWRQSESHGDKPGSGFILLSYRNETRGFYCMLDPNHPNDFTYAMRIPLHISKNTGRKIEFYFYLGNQEMISGELVFASSLRHGATVKATFSPKDQGIPMEILFRRWDE